jgi:hypothetical protein
MVKLMLSGVFVGCLLAPIAFAQHAPLPLNTVPCEAFKKNSNGDWVVQADVSFDAAGLSEAMQRDTTINSRKYNLDGLNMYELLEKKCISHG